MAMAHMMAQWAVEHDRHIHLLTVNHNLRDASQAEAEQVGQWSKDFPNSSHHILTWNYNTRPETAVMEQARNARYALMAEYCKLNNINVLSIAHHADDQLETFMFRLAKGSGLDGLCGMAEWTDYSDDLKIYRPLLTQTHNDLIAYCQSHHLQWIEDPSNKNPDYARPRLRKALAGEGFDSKRFVKTLGRLSRAQNALDEIAENTLLSLRKQGSDDEIPDQVREGNFMLIDFQKLQTHPHDIQIRVLQKALLQVGETQSGYPPKLERLEDIHETIRPSKSATLFGCLITLSQDGKTLEIRRV